MTIAIIVNTLILIVYSVLVFAIMYHYRKYSLPNDPRRFVINIFLIIAAILFILSYLIIVFFIDWESIKSGGENFFRIF